MTANLRYFAASLSKSIRGQDLACPSCGFGANQVLSRKYLVTTLRRCAQCRLMYRAPTTGAREAAKYYNKEYRSGLTTNLPSDESLQRLLECRFQGTGKDFIRYIRILQALNIPQAAQVLDYGCSWGYGVWQLKRAGYEAVGFDVASDRVAYGRKFLRVPLVADLSEAGKDFDVVFSAHVVEHVPNVKEVLNDLLMQYILPGGYLVLVTPNGSGDCRRRDSMAWDRKWGLKHPNFLDDQFYQRAFEGHRFLLTSRLGNLQAIREWVLTGAVAPVDLSGWELLAVVQR